MDLWVVISIAVAFIVGLLIGRAIAMSRARVVQDALDAALAMQSAQEQRAQVAEAAVSEARSALERVRAAEAALQSEYAIVRGNLARVSQENDRLKIELISARMGT